MAKVLYLFSAAALALIAAAHVFLGGPVVEPPLFTSTELPETAVWLLYFNRHVGTIALLVAAAALIYAALNPGNRALAAFFSAMVFGFGALGFGLSVLATEALWETPAPYAFGIIGVLAFSAVAADRR